MVVCEVCGAELEGGPKDPCSVCGFDSSKDRTKARVSRGDERSDPAGLWNPPRTGEATCVAA